MPLPADHELPTPAELCARLDHCARLHADLLTVPPNGVDIGIPTIASRLLALQRQASEAMADWLALHEDALYQGQLRPPQIRRLCIIAEASERWLEEVHESYMRPAPAQKGTAPPSSLV